MSVSYTAVESQVVNWCLRSVSGDYNTWLRPESGNLLHSLLIQAFKQTPVAVALYKKCRSLQKNAIKKIEADPTTIQKQKKGLRLNHEVALAALREDFGILEKISPELKEKDSDFICKVLCLRLLEQRNASPIDFGRFSIGYEEREPSESVAILPSVAPGIGRVISSVALSVVKRLKIWPF